MSINSRDRVVVTVYLQGNSRGKDLVVPTTIPVQTLARYVAIGLRQMPPDAPPVELPVFQEPGGVRLPADKSLGDLGIWDGSILVLAIPADATMSADTFAGPVLLTPRGRRLALTRPHYRIGRRLLKGEPSGEMIPLLDLGDEPDGRTVSHHHADLLFDDGARAWTLTARRSTNGTTVNGRVLSPEASYRLSNQDTIRLGDVELVFQVGSDV
jgi:hypothetical protein